MCLTGGAQKGAPYVQGSGITSTKPSTVVAVGIPRALHPLTGGFRGPVWVMGEQVGVFQRRSMEAKEVQNP